MDNHIAELVFKMQSDVRKIRGKNEYEVYQNYVNDLPGHRLETFSRNFHARNLKTKDDEKANVLRLQGNMVFKIKDFSRSFTFYSKSLRYATYNGEAYAIALANRSAASFSLGDYKNCLQDIDLCLKGQYPSVLKPKVFIRKVQCLQKLGQRDEMMEVLDKTAKYIKNATDLTTADIATYSENIEKLMVAKIDNPKPEVQLNLLPALNPNPTFLNASASISLKHNKIFGRHVVANEPIAQGEALFVEKIYAFCPVYNNSKMVTKKYCQYCLQALNGCVPCKKCVKHLYCTEKCRDDAWTEFHQWECVAIQAGLFAVLNTAHLPLRLVLKGAHTGFPTISGNVEEDLKNYGNKDDNYPYVYKLCTHFHDIKKKKLLTFASHAAILVSYLIKATNFIEWMKSLPHFANKNDAELTNKLGGLLIRHFAQIPCNDVVIRELEIDGDCLTEIFNTILPSVAMMSHSCIPNIAYYFVNDTIVVKALKDVKVNEQLYMSYMDLTYSVAPKEVREELLNECLHFRCKCQGCTDPLMDIKIADSFPCIKCSGPATVTSDFNKCTCWKCHQQFRVPYEVFIKEGLVADYVNTFEKKQNVEDAHRALELCRSILSPSHQLFPNIHLMLMKYFLAHGNLSVYTEYAKMFEEYVIRRHGKYSFRHAIMNYRTLFNVVQALTKHTWSITDAHFSVVVQEFKSCINEIEKMFEMHHPMFLPRIQKMQDIISALQLEPTYLSWICGKCQRIRLDCHCSSSESSGDYNE